MDTDLITPETGALRRVAARWPTALAVAISIPGFLGGAPAAGVLAGSLGDALMMLPLAYLTVAKLGRRRATWPVVVAAVAVVVVARTLDLVSPAVVLSTLALAVLAWGVADGQLRRDGCFRVQALGLAGFGALTIAGLALLATHPGLGVVVVAAGWFLHGVWDFVHLARDAVVARSFAEWCGVIDVLLAVQLLFLL